MNENTQIALSPAENAIMKLSQDPKYADFDQMFKSPKDRDRFVRSFRLLTATNPGILDTDQKSLFLSLYKAAHDGLIVDGVKATLTIFNTKRGNEFIKCAQYIPMVKGVRDKVYEFTGMTITANIVYAGENFEYEEGDSPKLKHIPNLTVDLATVKPLAVYALARTATGEVMARTVMRISEVYAIMNKSKSKDRDGKLVGPWVDHFGEMAKKTAVKRLAKELPLPEKVEEILDRDNDFYDIGHNPTKQINSNAEPIRNVLAETVTSTTETVTNQETGEVTQPENNMTPEEMNEALDLMTEINDLRSEKTEILETKYATALPNIDAVINSSFKGLSLSKIKEQRDFLFNLA